MAENPEQPKVMANVSRPSASASNVTSRGGSMSPSLSNNSASNHNLFINSSSSSPVMGSSQHGGAAAGADGGPVASEGFPRGGGESGGEDVDSQSDVGKIFVGGLNWLTTPDTLREYFGKFGPVSECVIMRSPLTHKSRGFGFVTFVEPSDVDKVLNILIHQVDGKKIDPKLAVPRRSQLPQKVAIVTRTKKAFVGGISTTTTQEDLQAYFSTFGTVEDATLMYDKATKRHRGFGFISFASEDVVDTVCEIHYHEINGKVVECKKAQPREVLSPSNSRSRAASLFGFRRNGLYHPRGAGYPGFGLFPPFYPGLPAYLGFYPGFGGDRHGFFDYSLTMPNFAPSSSNLFASGSSGVASSRRTEDVNETDASREGALSNRNSGFSNSKQGSRQYSTSSSPPYPTSNSLTHPYSAKMLSSLSPLIGTTNPLDMSSLTRALPKDSQYLQNLSLQNYLHQNASAASAHTRPLPSNYTGPNGPPAISNPATRSMGPTPTSHLTNPHVPSKSHSSSSVEDSAVTRVPTVYNNGSA